MPSDKKLRGTDVKQHKVHENIVWEGFPLLVNLENLKSEVIVNAIKLKQTFGSMGVEFPSEFNSKEQEVSTTKALNMSDLVIDVRDELNFVSELLQVVRGTYCSGSGTDSDSCDDDGAAKAEPAVCQTELGRKVYEYGGYINHLYNEIGYDLRRITDSFFGRDLVGADGKEDSADQTGDDSSITRSLGRVVTQLSGINESIIGLNSKINAHFNMEKGER